MNTRFLGILCSIGSVVGVADGARLVMLGHLDIPGFRDLDTINILAQIIWSIGCLSGLLGMIALHATGTKPVFRSLTYVPIIGYLALIVGYLISLSGVPTANNPVGIIGQLLAMGGMLVVAILTIAVKIWTGWRKYAPLLTILAIPVGAVLVGITGLDGIFSIVNGAAWLLLGYAVYSIASVVQFGEAMA